MSQYCPRCRSLLFDSDVLCPTCAVVSSHRTRFARVEKRDAAFYAACEGVIIGFGLACGLGLLWLCW